jgi:hypothetical protein
MLLREYAIQPEVLTNLESIRFFLDQTGVWQGRMISRYPKKWLALVYTACASCRPAEKARMEMRLKDVARKLVASDRPYDHSIPTWAGNVLAEHSHEPFSGVILIDSDPSPRSATVVGASDVDENCPCWHVSRDMIVQRETVALCRPATHLLRMSKQVVFVDRYFDCGVSHGPPLAAFLTEALKGCIPTRLEYHFDGAASHDHVREKLRKMLPFLPLPAGVPLRFIRWKDGLHPRYILTEYGGLKYDWGLGAEEGRATDVHLLDSGIYRQRWGEYCATSTAFTFLDGFEILSGQVYRIEPAAGQFKNVGLA